MNLNDLKIFYGHYQSNPWACHSCSATIDVFKEKMTDVNIAVELLTDAFQDNFDVALIISADSDLKGPIQKTKELFPEKRIVVAFPPGRSSVELKNTADACFHIGRVKWGQVLSAPSEAWQFLPVRVRIRQRVATSLTPIPHSGG